MFTLLIPLLTLFAGVIKADDDGDFTKPVTVEFIVHDYETYTLNGLWSDWTVYEDKTRNLTGKFEVKGDDKVGFMNFERPNDRDTARHFYFRRNESLHTVKHCDVWLKEEPKSHTLTYDLINDTFGPTIEDTRFLKIKCNSAPESALPSYMSTATQQPPSTHISSDSGPTTPVPLPPAVRMKENLLITFMTEPDNLIDDTAGKWWTDTTKYEDIDDDSFEVLNDADKKLLQEVNTEKQFGLGQMKYKGLSSVKRTWTWEPKPVGDQESVVKNCKIVLNGDIDPGVPEMWIWAANLDVELRRDGKRIEKAEEDKFRKDGIIELKCE